MDYDLHLGERLDVLIGEKKCISDVQEITAKGTLYVTMPTHHTLTIPVHPGELVQMIYYRAQGMYSFVGGVLRSFKEGNLQLLEVQFKSPISKYQRRDFVRFEADLTVRTAKLAEASALANKSVEEILRTAYDKAEALGASVALGDPVEGQTLDISGGGLRFVSPNSFEHNTLLHCTLWLKDQPLKADAVVVRSDEDSESGSFVICVQFVGIEETDRRKIIKYIFSQQLKDREVHDRK